MTRTHAQREVDLLGEDSPSSPRQKFIEAALDLFAEHGYDGTSLQMIGDRVGVTKAAVAYHFGSKDDLLVAVVEPAFADLRVLLTRVEAGRRKSERRNQALEGYVEYLVQHRQVSAWIARDVAVLSHSDVIDLLHDFVVRIDALLVGAHDVQARIWASAIYQALNGPILTATEATDEELRFELAHIGRHLIRSYHSARRQTRDDTTTITESA